MDGSAGLVGRCLGVPAPCLISGLSPALLLPGVSSLSGRDEADEAASCSFEVCVFTLFLLLDVLKIPPRPPPPPPPRAFAGSVSPPDFLRGSVQALRSLLGDGLRSGNELDELLFALGSTMRGTGRSTVDRSAVMNASVEARVFEMADEVKGRCFV